MRAEPPCRAAEETEHCPQVAFAEKRGSDPTRPTPPATKLDKLNPARRALLVTHFLRSQLRLILRPGRLPGDRVEEAVS